MGENWESVRGDITSALMQDGRKFVFERLITEEYNPIDAAYLDGKEESFIAYGIFKSLGSKPTLEYRLQTTIEIGDKVLMLDVSTYTPQIGDMTEIDEELWKVKAFSLLEPAGISLLAYVLISKD